MSFFDQLTIIIPTANRADFISRLIRYYASIKYFGKIIIGDSSQPEEQDRIAEILSSYNDKLNLNFIRFPAGASHPEKAVALAGHIETPYATLGADDDFILPSGMAACVEFLESAPDYSTAHGDMLIFSLDTVYGQVDSFNRYVTRSNEHDDPVARINQQFCEYYVSNFYAVRRSEVLIKMLQAMWLIDSDRHLSILAEPVAEAITAIYGKIKKLNLPFAVRQYCSPVSKLTRPDDFDWVLYPDFHVKFPAYQKLVSFEIGQKLRSQGKVVDYNTIATFVKKSFSFFLARTFIQYATEKDQFPIPADCQVSIYSTDALLKTESAWHQELSYIVNVINTSNLP